jgi:hypothetical protein
MTTLTKDIEETITELEEQWRIENEERINDYKEKLNVLEGYLNEQYSINEEIKSLGEIVLSQLGDGESVYLKYLSIGEKQHIETQRFLTYLRGTDKKTSSTVREMFGVVTKNTHLNVDLMDELRLEEDRLLDQVNVYLKDISEWKKHHIWADEQINNLVEDPDLRMLFMKLPKHSMNENSLDEAKNIMKDINLLDESVKSFGRKIDKLSNKISIDYRKICKRMVNLGFIDIYEELTKDLEWSSTGNSVFPEIRKVKVNK